VAAKRKIPVAVGNRTSIVHRWPEQSCCPASSLPSVALTNRLLQMQCCGIDGPADYRGAGVVDWSCCQQATQNEASCHSILQRGCLVSLNHDIQSRVLLMSVLSIATAIIQVNITQTLPTIEARPALCYSGLGAMYGL